MNAIHTLAASNFTAKFKSTCHFRDNMWAHAGAVVIYHRTQHCVGLIIMKLPGFAMCTNSDSHLPYPALIYSTSEATF